VLVKCGSVGLNTYKMQEYVAGVRVNCGSLYT